MLDVSVIAIELLSVVADVLPTVACSVTIKERLSLDDAVLEPLIVSSMDSDEVSLVVMLTCTADVSETPTVASSEPS